MSDKKLTDEEIIKRLERCVKRGNRNYDTDIVLDLINRQKSEIERLKEKSIVDDKLLNDRVQEAITTVSKANQKYVDALEKAFNDRTAELKTAKEEVEKLTQCPDCRQTNENINIAQIKSEAVKEFAKRLKSYLLLNKIGEMSVISFENIANLLKEMVGEEE